VVAQIAFYSDEGCCNKLYAGGRHDMPTPLLPLWASKRLAPPSTTQRSSSFPRLIRSHAYSCSCLMS